MVGGGKFAEKEVELLTYLLSYKVVLSQCEVNMQQVENYCDSKVINFL